jgi:hypothetical protein
MSHEIEELLRRYRPLGPTPELRAHVMSPPVDARRAWPWLAAAAALLAVVAGLNVATERLTGSWAEPLADHQVHAIEQLAEVMGGNERARRIARAIVVSSEPDVQTPAATSGSDR